MTREEAINALGNFKRYISGGGVTDRKANEAIDMAIEALEQEPVVRCKDCTHKYVTGDVTQYYVCDFMDAQYEDDGYCHHGEREEK